MKLENLKPAKGATHNTKRVGRGQGSGKGGTATRVMVPLRFASRMTGSRMTERRMHALFS